VNINPNNTLEIYAPKEGIFKDEYIQEKLETNAGWNFPSPDEEWIRGYGSELTDFIDCFRENKEPVSGLMLAEDTIRVIYSAYVSAEEGRRVAV
jgi:predicted dehydrogenase